MDRLRLILELEPGETACGVVGPAGGPHIGFHGWIGLMSAISEIRNELVRPADGQDPGRGPAE